MNTCSCGAEAAPVSAGAGVLCPACLLRLGLDRDGADAFTDDPLDNVHLFSPIGRGPHGVVYLGRRAFPEPRLLALKLIDCAVVAPQFVEKIRSVVQRLHTSQAGSAVTLLDACLTGEQRPCVLAAYAAGNAIDRYFRERRGADHTLLSLLIALCTRVAEMHRAGIVHGGIKPSNVIIRARGGTPEPVFLDVGVCPAIEGSRMPLPAAAKPLHEAHSGAPAIAHDLAALQRLVGDLLNEDRSLPAGVAPIRASITRCRYDSASQLAADLASLSRQWS